MVGLAPKRIQYQRGSLLKEAELLPIKELRYYKSPALKNYRYDMVVLADYIWDSLDDNLHDDSSSKRKIQYAAAKAVIKHVLDIDILMEERKQWAEANSTPDGGKLKQNYSSICKHKTKRKKRRH